MRSVRFASSGWSFSAEYGHEREGNEGGLPARFLRGGDLGLWKAQGYAGWAWESGTGGKDRDGMREGRQMREGKGIEKETEREKGACVHIGLKPTSTPLVNTQGHPKHGHY